MRTWNRKLNPIEDLENRDTRSGNTLPCKKYCFTGKILAYKSLRKKSAKV